MPNDAGKELSGIAVERTKAQVELEKEILKLNLEKKSLYEQQRSEQESSLALIEEEYKAQVEFILKQKEELKLRKEQNLISKEELAIEEAILKKQVEGLAALKIKSELEKESLKSQREQLSYTDELIARFTGLGAKPLTGISRFIADPKGFSQALGESISKVKNSMNILTSLIDNVIIATTALAFANDQAIVGFRKATSAGGEFDAQISSMERSLYHAGVTSEEASGAFRELYLNVSDFTLLTKSEQSELAETVGILNELGISSSTVTKNLQFSIKALGLSVRQAGKLQVELRTFAKELGVSGDQIASDFQKMGPTIASLGDSGVDAFRALAIQAKETGMEISTLLDLTKQFDTFDSAASAVGRLNALLGGPFLNTMELVAETDPSERFRILKERVDDAGFSFDTMDYYQRKAMASAVGLNEEQLAMMMRGRIDLIQPQKTAEEMEELLEQTAQFNSVMDELMQIGKMFAISLAPVVKWTKDFLQWIQEIAGYSPFPDWFHASAIALTILSIVGLKVTSMLIGLAASINTALTVAATAAPPAVVALEATAAAAGAAAAPVSAFGIALLEVGAAIALIGLGVVALGATVWLITTGIGNLIGKITEFFGETLSTSFSLLASSITSVGKTINELDTTKTIALGVALKAAAVAAPSIAVSAAAIKLASGTLGIAGGPTESTVASVQPASATGPMSFNVSLTLDGKEFAAVVNNVEVIKNGGTDGQGRLYRSIMDTQDV